MDTLTATVRQQGEGEQSWFCGGGTFTWKVTGAETGGAFFMFEDDLEQGKVTPLHIHPNADETFYLLEGEILLHIDGEETRLGAGGVVAFPRNVPHAFMVTSPTARMLTFQNPAAGEAFYRHASEAQPTPVDFDRIRAAAEATGAIEILGPPPFRPPA
ncbi:cupin domain-containing protein [Nocardioides sp. WS12]|uniref:cupin domain-containing protein n=1 Tax=Nocardioides sp. WS12 TaxID=2486272 RepID=UPI0015FB6B00|nr:cupin domain-containing protein [Nocardioides sp. WS12]